MRDFMDASRQNNAGYTEDVIVFFYGRENPFQGTNTSTFAFKETCGHFL